MTLSSRSYNKRFYNYWRSECCHSLIRGFICFNICYESLKKLYLLHKQQSKWRPNHITLTLQLKNVWKLAPRCLIKTKWHYCTKRKWRNWNSRTSPSDTTLFLISTLPQMKLTTIYVKCMMRYAFAQCQALVARKFKPYSLYHYSFS